MVRTFDRDESTVWVMPRDEQMLLWFSIVRIANVQSVRWVLGTLNGQDRPVSTRRAQLGGPGGSLVWATYKGVNMPKPNLYRQTTRHEVAIAAASARYAAAGYAWQRDVKPSYAGGHQADGTALSPGWIELIEVELTGKRMPRYVQIFTSFRRRFEIGDISAVTYLCTADSARTVRDAVRSLPAGRAIADRVTIRQVYDQAGLWADDELPVWMTPARSRAADATRVLDEGRGR